ncbi:Oidioi.mRNA.OKI2018_I69.XSR.g16705.t1.cds [Oikopleura dioica]|uniref:Oidioi.mRNA.OKI2018_I69.XSR.g16705.t1.cds n=1 Tax=Oikopleura dioica TaxID=34765 RepID=A0ABN7SKZ1_OIKDI|nr:Oidioi.mRNA.OKI2018_I69.XSR.g16705.t1.cds [Oikopleura dioica]
MAGITDTQTQRQLAGIGMSGETIGGHKRLPDFVKGASTADKYQDKVDKIIMDLANQSMLNARNLLISERKNASEKTVSVAVDGTYNDSGIKKNSAQGCLVSCAAKVDGKYKIIGSKVVKKRQEISDEHLKKYQRGTVAPTGTASSALEKIGTRHVFEETLLPIHKALPDHVIQVACDADAKIRDPSNTNVYIDAEKCRQLMIPLINLAFHSDVAHIIKNIYGTFLRNFKTGSGADKFTKKQFLQFHMRVKFAIMEIITNRASGEWSHEDAMNKMEKTLRHAYSDHTMCDENCPRGPGIFQPFGNLTQEIIEERLRKFISTHFGENYIRECGQTGTTSPVEYLHAEMIRRRLWVKGTYASPLNYRYEVAGATAILIYNEGEVNAIRQIHKKLQYKVSNVGLDRLQRLDEESKKKCDVKMKKKAEIQNKRRQTQKQFADLGTYASQVQRDIDNARQAHIQSLEAKDLDDADEIPTFEELLQFEEENSASDFIDDEEEVEG